MKLSQFILWKEKFEFKINNFKIMGIKIHLNNWPIFLVFYIAEEIEE